MNDLIGDERLSVGSYPVLGLDPPDCPSEWQMTVSLLRNQIITHFQTLLHLGCFGPMFCCSVSSLLKKIFWNYFPILGQLHGLTLPDSLPRASSLNSYSSSDLSSSQQWLRFPAVVQALRLDTHTYMNTYLYTDLYIYYTHTHTHRICMRVCIKILLGISALMFLSSVSIQVMEILAKLRKWLAYFIFTQLICWSMILRGPSYLNTYCKTKE